jgi:glycosyltransferase involved in cell wall biosynthesis
LDQFVRLFIHDYAGHAFSVQLSRRLASRGNTVLHAYCASNLAPRGHMVKRPDDSAGFDVRGIALERMIPKTGYIRRFQLEIAYGKRLVEEFHRFRPDVVLSGQTPSIPQHRLTRACNAVGVPHIFWIQDAYGLAVYKLLSRKLPIVGHAVGRYFMWLDRQSALRSDSVTVITEDFVPMLEQWGVDRRRIHVIHNWSLIEELPIRPRENCWSKAQQLQAGPRFIYSGTLAMKHNPALLLELAKRLDRSGRGQVIVVSEGPGVEWLQREAKIENVRSLTCLPYQPFEQMPDVLGSADVLVVVLEKDAGAFSVPSKILSYMCAGRAILGAIPAANLAARLISENEAGVVVEPGDVASFCQTAEEMIQCPEARAQFAAAARRYAETHFDLDQIADRFEEILCRQAGSKSAKGDAPLVARA